MSRRMLLASGVEAIEPPDPEPGDGGGDGGFDYPVAPSYAIPTTRPYNVPNRCVTPTNDGSGHVIHPDGIVFAHPWNGHCFWHAATAFYAANVALENPHVYYSDDGWNWHWPPGVSNPIDPNPDPAHPGAYNSDTDIVFDPDANRLIVTWREVWGTDQIIYASTSSNGSSWSAPIHLVTATSDGFASVSQSLVRVSATEWRMYFATGDGTGKPTRFLTSTSPLGPWNNETYTQVYYSGAFTPYHGDVTYHDGIYYALFQRGGLEYPASSTDGINFTVRPSILGTGTYGGDLQQMYRSSIAPHDNGTHMHVWYSNSIGEPGVRFAHYVVVPRFRFTG